MNWEEPKKQRWYNPRMIAWAIFDIGLGMFSMVVLSRYAGPWIVDQLKGSEVSFNVMIGFSMALAGLLQIVLSPISDELGKRRVFVICFTSLMVIGCGLMSKATTLKTALLLLGATNIGYQTAVMFYNSMLSDISDERHRARVSGIGMALGYLGSIVGIVVALKYVKVDHVSKVIDYSPVYLIIAALIFAFALPLFFFVKEKPSLVRLNLTQSLRNSIGSFIITLRRIGRNRQMLFFFVGVLFAFDVVETVVINMTLYCKEVANLSEIEGFDFSPTYMGKVLVHIRIPQIDLFLMTSIVFAILGALIIGHISDKTNHYKTLMAVLVLWMITLVLAMFSVHRALFWITGPLFGIGFGGLRTVGRAYLLEICHPEERGQMFAIYGLVGRGAAVLGPLVWAATFYLAQPYLGQRAAYRTAIAAMLILMIIGFCILARGKPKDGSLVS